MLPFPHKIVAGNPESDPFLLISGPSIDSNEESLYVQMKEAGGLYIGVKGGTNNTFQQPLKVMLRWSSSPTVPAIDVLSLPSGVRQLPVLFTLFYLFVWDV